MDSVQQVFDNQENWLELASAIVLQAYKDYKEVMVYLRDDAMNHEPNSQYHLYRIKNKIDCERFFKGTWCKVLTDIDGREIMKEIRYQVRNRK